jgi:DinB superfamily
MTVTSDVWVDALAVGAPDVVAAWRGTDAEDLRSIRREVRRRAGAGSVDRVVQQLAETAAALTDLISAMPSERFSAPGGEGDWNVAEATGHVADARAGLCLAASKAASGAWPTDARAVVPGTPGPPDADRDALLRRIGQSQRIVERCARSVHGHELDPCPLDHPLVGRLRCGEWLLFAGVHDLMHLEQLHGIASSAG